jgi:hypothetical protein
MTLLTLFNQYRVPASQTAAGKERLREYFEALGRFVDMFSRAEAAVSLTLWHYAKTSPDIAKIIFAGAKVDLSATFIRQLAHATGASQELRDDLEEALQQLGIINRVRNQVLHYGADQEAVADGRAMVSDALKAKGEPSIFPINPTILADLTADVHKIIAHLETNHLQTGRYTILGNPMYGSWRYKHPVQASAPSKKAQARPPKTRDP